MSARQLKEVIKVYENIKATYSTMVNTTSQYIVDLRNELVNAENGTLRKDPELWKEKLKHLELQTEMAVLKAQNLNE